MFQLSICFTEHLKKDGQENTRKIEDGPKSTQLYSLWTFEVS